MHSKNNFKDLRTSKYHIYSYIYTYKKLSALKYQKNLFIKLIKYKNSLLSGGNRTCTSVILVGISIIANVLLKYKKKFICKTEKIYKFTAMRWESNSHLSN